MAENTTRLEFDPVRTAIANELKNRELIGRRVLPLMNTGGKTVFSYNVLDSNLDGFKAPDSTVGKTAMPNRVSVSMTKKPESTEGYALMDFVPVVDDDNSDDDYDPLEAAQNNIVSQLWNGHEKRVAQLVKAQANYGHKHNLTAPEKLNNPDAAIPKILAEHFEQAIVRPNRMVIGGDVAIMLRSHPSVIQALSGAAVTNGLASLQALADLLELDEIIVGRAYVNTASKGKEPNFDKPWDGVMAAHYIDASANPARESTQPTWGFTASSMDLSIYTGMNDAPGTRGVHSVKAAFEQKELITAKDAGVLFGALT